MPDNYHPQLPDSELHDAHRLIDAATDSHLEKNFNDEQEFFVNNYGRPVIDTANIANQPPTTADGDRYILTNPDSTASVHGGWSGVNENEVVEFVGTGLDGLDVNAWKGITPVTMHRVPATTPKVDYVYNGTEWLPVGVPILFDKTFTHAQISSGNTTPLDIITAPGSGNYVRILDAATLMTYGGTAYSGFTGIEIMSEGATQPQVSHGSILATTVTTFMLLVLQQYSGGTNTQLIDNAKVQWRVQIGDPSDGHADTTLRMMGHYVIYRT